MAASCPRSWWLPCWPQWLQIYCYMASSGENWKRSVSGTSTWNINKMADILQQTFCIYIWLECFFCFDSCFTEISCSCGSSCVSIWLRQSKSSISQWYFPIAVSSLNNVNQLIHYDNQLTVVEQYFTNIAAIQNMRYNDKFDSKKSMGGILLICRNITMRVYRAWIKDIVFYVKKHIAPGPVCSNFPLFATSR